MIPAANAVLLAITAVVLVPCGVFLIECLAALLPERRRVDANAGTTPRTTILIPAHDEEAVIAQTLQSLKPQLGALDRLLVVADNCTDRTAEIARGFADVVVERQDPDRRGKGYALAFGVTSLEQDPPDVVIVVDADCRVEAGALALLTEEAMIRDCPIQADYVLTSSSKSASSVISELAFLVRNRVRPIGLHRLRLPCHLTGSGMAFPWPVLRDAPPMNAWLVEDLLMGLELALQGRPPMLCPRARVSSVLPEGEKTAIGQRRRWEHGQMETLLRTAPRLVKQAFRAGDLRLLALALDLVVPPLALLVLLVMAWMILCAVAAALGLVGWLSLSLTVGGFLAVIFGVLVAWAKYGRETVPFRYLLSVPFYIAWKIPLYLSFFLKKRQRTWERTERGSEQSAQQQRKRS